MEYNTQSPIKLKEYGRNVQNMAQQLFDISDRDARNKGAKHLISVMANMMPNQRDNKDFKQKLWDHLAYITNYELDIDYPFEIRRKNEMTKSSHLPYSQGQVKYLHYGKTIQDLIEKAISLEEGDVKEALIIQIANHMKKSHVNWNKNTVTDHVILNDLRKLSNGQLDIDDEMKLTRRINYNSNGNNGSNHRRNNNNNNGQRRNNNNNNNNRRR